MNVACVCVYCYLNGFVSEIILHAEGFQPINGDEYGVCGLCGSSHAHHTQDEETS